MRTAADEFEAFRAIAASAKRIAFVDTPGRTVLELELRQSAAAFYAQSHESRGFLSMISQHCQFDHRVVPGDFEGPSHSGSGYPDAPDRLVRYAGALLIFPGDGPDEVFVVHTVMRGESTVLLEFNGELGEVAYYRLAPIALDALAALIYGDTRPPAASSAANSAANSTGNSGLNMEGDVRPTPSDDPLLDPHKPPR